MCCRDHLRQWRLFCVDLEQIYYTLSGRLVHRCFVTFVLKTCKIRIYILNSFSHHKLQLSAYTRIVSKPLWLRRTDRVYSQRADDQLGKYFFKLFLNYFSEFFTPCLKYYSIFQFFAQNQHESVPFCAWPRDWETKKTIPMNSCPSSGKRPMNQPSTPSGRSPNNIQSLSLKFEASPTLVL